VAAVAEECGVGVERMSCLFDFAERVQRAARLAASQPTLLNGLTEQETAASASVAGLSGAQPEAPAEPKRAALPATRSIVAKLKAMSENYSGGHCWDSLDSVTCAAAAATIEFLLATPAPVAQQPAELTDAAIEAAWQTAHRPDGFDKRWFANAIIKAQGGSQ
jgi:hypothetical protein